MNAQHSTSPTLAPAHEEDPTKDIVSFDMGPDDTGLDLVYDDFAYILPTEQDQVPVTSEPSPETNPIPISSDEGGLSTKRFTQRRRSTQITSSPSSEVSSDEDEEKLAVTREEERKRRKAMRALNRMMPAVMISKIAGRKPAPIRKASNDSSSSGSESDVGRAVRRNIDESEEIVPGQSRIRKAVGVREVVEIKGDSESSDSDSDSARAGGIVSDEDASSLSKSPGALFDDDEAMEYDWVTNDSNHYSKDIQLRARRGEDLIDRMLSRTRTNRATSRPHNGRSRRRTTGNDPRPRRKEATAGISLTKGALDVVIPSSGHNRQTLLPFTRDRSTPDYDAFSNASIGADHFDSDVEVFGQTDVEVARFSAAHDNPPAKLSKRQWKKKRSERLSAQQTYTVPSDGKLITSGRRAGPLAGDGVRVDFANKHEGFVRALAPVLPSNAKGTSEAVRARVTIGQLGKVRKSRITKRSVNWSVIESSRQTTLHEFVPQEVTADIEVDFSSPQQRQNLLTHRNGIEQDYLISTRLSEDLGIEKLQIGLTFGPSTYIGRQWLHQLMAVGSPTADANEPVSYDGFDIVLSASLSANEFSERVEGVCAILCDWLVSGSEDAESEIMVRNYDFLVHATCSHMSWQLARASEDVAPTLQTVNSYATRRLTEQVRDILQQPSLTRKSLNMRLFSVIWAVVELNTRWILQAKPRNLNNVEMEEDWRESTLLMMRCLIGYGLKRSIQPLQDGDISMNAHLVASRTAQVWICLIYLAPVCAQAFSSPPKDLQGRPQQLFWQLLDEALHDGPLANKSDFEASEHIWMILFGLNCLSQVSPHGVVTANVRLLPCWELVTTALSAIRLAHDPEDDKQPTSIMLKRDKYVRLVVSRCYLLRSRWHWRLNDAYSLFNRLVDIFKSRKYMGLLDEESDFPAFLRHSDLSMLRHVRRSDTAFSLFLKLVVQAAEDDHEVTAEVISGVATINMRKILSLAVPLTAVPFSRETPPSGRELSMLYNRFSALCIAIFLEPTLPNIRARIAQARRYISFSSADQHSRKACLRAVVHIAVLLKHLKLPLDEPLSWLAQMTDTLLDEFRHSIVAKVGALNRVNVQFQQIVACTQMLLKSVSLIIESKGMNPDAPSQANYPDVALLDGREWYHSIHLRRRVTFTLR
jgi:hypothetical protein